MCLSKINVSLEDKNAMFLLQIFIFSFTSPIIASYNCCWNSFFLCFCSHSCCNFFLMKVLFNFSPPCVILVNSVYFHYVNLTTLKHGLLSFFLLFSTVANCLFSCQFCSLSDLLSPLGKTERFFDALEDNTRK